MSILRIFFASGRITVISKTAGSNLFNYDARKEAGETKKNQEK